MPPELDRITKEAHELGIVKKPEDILTYALYPAIAPRFLRGEIKEEALLAPKPNNGKPALLPTEFKVEVDGDVFNVKIVSAGGGMVVRQAETELPKTMDGAVTASMQGMVLKIKVKKGDSVNKGDVVMVLEAMKMENNIHASHAGAVKDILVKEGSTVSAGDALMVIG